MPRPKRPSRTAIDPDRFRQARAVAKLTREEAADYLGVTPHTVRNWEAGKTAIPYAPYRLLRLLAGYEFPHPSWQDFTLRGDTLWSPEQKPFKASDFVWWSLTCNMARHWREDYARRQQERTLLQAQPQQATQAAPGVRGAALTGTPQPANDPIFAPSKPVQTAPAVEPVRYTPGYLIRKLFRR
jgi:DNA-binding XRE family transcriptional regulator